MSNGDLSARWLLLLSCLSLAAIVLYRREPGPVRSTLTYWRVGAGAACFVVSVLCVDYLLNWAAITLAVVASAYVLMAAPFWVGLIGGCVGSVELVARYRDNPLTALRTGPAWLYVLINILACEIVLVVLQIVQPDWLYEKTAEPQRLLYLILSAGFGAIALFRSSIFKLKTADGELAVGPAVVLDTLLAASDRAVDRRVAAPRGMLVAEIMDGVSFDHAKVALPTYCFALMQNVSHQEQKDVGDQVNYLATATMNDKIRSLNLGLVLLNVVGEEVLRGAIGNLTGLIQGEIPIDQRDIAKIYDVMDGVDFIKAVPALQMYCFSLIGTVPPEAQAAFGNNLQNLVQSGLSPKVKSLVLGLALANVVGFPALKLAVGQLGAEIR